MAKQGKEGERGDKSSRNGVASKGALQRGAVQVTGSHSTVCLCVSVRIALQDR